MQFDGIKKFLIEDEQKTLYSIVWSSEFNGISIFWSLEQLRNAKLLIFVRRGGIEILSIDENEKAHESI